MEDLETPLEHLNEEMHHIAAHAQENWLKLGALLAALLAVLAAITGMESGHEVNLAMLKQIEASDAWSYYQAKGIKSMIVESAAVQNDKTKAKIKKYEDEQAGIKMDADTKMQSSRRHFHYHEILSRAVTLFQVAIAITAIAMLTRQRRFLLVASFLGLFGIVFFIQYLWSVL